MYRKFENKPEIVICANVNCSLMLENQAEIANSERQASIRAFDQYKCSMNTSIILPSQIAFNNWKTGVNTNV